MTKKLEQAARQALNWIDANAPRYVFEAVEKALAKQAEYKECGAKQAQIDRLMLEYCPDEMTPEQMQEWGNNQRSVEQAEQEPVAYLRMGSDQRFVVTKAAEELVADKFHELYTHPVRTKDLTDDDKANLVMEHLGSYSLIGVKMSIYEAFLLGVEKGIAADRRKNR